MLVVWPDHCIVGTAGHAVVKNISDALQKWSVARSRRVEYVYKGMVNLTEMYSAVEAEVPIESDPSTKRNLELLNLLRNPKRLIVCGQALSHCVKWTVHDIMSDWLAHHCDPRRMCILEDCTSPVETGDGEFPRQGREFLAKMRDLGVKVTTSPHAFEE